MPDLTPDHPAVLAAARAALKNGWTCDTHEPEEWGVCPDCTESHLRTAHRALTAALPHLTAHASRAVIELTAELDAYREENTRLREQAARVKSLADRLDAEAADDFDGVSGTSVSLVKYETAKAIRAAYSASTDSLAALSGTITASVFTTRPRRTKRGPVYQDDPR